MLGVMHAALSTTFKKLKPSWGFNECFDLAVLFHKDSGLLTMVPEVRVACCRRRDDGCRAGLSRTVS